MARARILVVEDEELVALSIKKCLEGLGYDVPAIVVSGEEAVKKTATLGADLVLMDIHLKGGMSGIDAAGLIRDSAHVPVVFLIAYSDDETLSKAESAGPFGYVLKPFEERSLEATVKMALSHSATKPRKRGYESLIQKTEEALKDTESAQETSPQSLPQSPGPVGKQEHAHYRATEARSADGHVELRISEDHMVAVATFAPAVGAGRHIVLADVRELLVARGLRFGVDWDAVESLVATCNAKQKVISNAEIAHGLKPTDEVNSHLEIEPSLLTKEPVGESEALVVDFKNRSPFQLVRKGDHLARMVPRVEGVAGMDVTGAAVAYGRAVHKVYRPGKNTVVDGDAIVAVCDGKFVVGEDSFWVSEVLEITGDVDYSTGHIDFPGDVVVHGQIKQGFNVKAGGSLTCAKTIDASEIICGGNLETDQGILGRAQSTVKVSGYIRAKFIENCSVEAGGDVTVSTGCLNSVINTLGAVTTGAKGVIIGGRVSALKGVVAFQVGSPAGVKTEISCGDDYRIQQKLSWVKDKNSELVLKLKEVEASLASREQGNPRLVQMRDKLKTAIDRMNESTKTLIAALHKNKEATVAVKGDLHQGVFAEICHVPFQVAKPMSGIRLVLDKASLVVTAEHLGRT